MLSPAYCGFFWTKLSAIWGVFLYMGKYKHKKRAVFVGCHFNVHFNTSTISIIMKIFNDQKMVIYGCQKNWGWSLINFSPLRPKLLKTFPNEAIKVEKILKGSLDSIPSPLMKIQIKCGKVCLRCKGKTLLALSTNFWKQKVCWHHPAMFCLITSSKLSRQ